MEAVKAIHFSLALGVLVAVYFFPTESVEQAPGVLVEEEPRQSAPVLHAFDHRGFHITPLAAFHIRARVLTRESYWMGRESSLSPLDLTLGWGLMSDQRTLDRLRLGRGYRRFTVEPRAGVTRDELGEWLRHSANVHLIPATAALEKQLLAAKRGAIVELDGHLIEAVGADSWRWRSSLTREDTGDGACELLWVEWMRPAARGGG